MNRVNRTLWRSTAAGLAVLFAAMFGASRLDAATVRTPHVMREDQVDLRSVESIVRSVVRPGMSDREKAMAIYRFLASHVFHWGSTAEGPDPTSFEYGIVYDPIKLINVYGYGYCFQNNAALEALWQAAGLDARSAGIGGHAISEVHYDGAWHFLDADQKGYCLLPDGRTIASIEQIVADPVGLLLDQKHPSQPFFPATRAPKVPYESKIILASYFWTEGNNYYIHDKIDVGHTMDITLLPGMRFTRRFRPDGRWVIRNNRQMERDIGYGDPAEGPRDFLDADNTYSNGQLVYQPDLTTRTGEYPDGVWEEANIARTDGGLTPSVAGREAWAVFRVRLPYAIAGWPTSLVGDPAPVGAAVVSASFHNAGPAAAQRIRLSTDEGRTWLTVWESNGRGTQRAVVDVSPHVVSKYEYLVRFDLGDRPGVRIEKLAIGTGFQCAPRALPDIREGDNRMVFQLGDQSEVHEIVADLSDEAAFFRQLDSHADVQVDDGSLTSVEGRIGEIVFKLVPPRPGTVTGLSLGAGCRRSPGEQDPRDDIQVDYAQDAPERWTRIADDDYPAYAGHWSYRVNASGTCAPGTRAAFVKVTIRTARSASIRHLRLRFRWRPDGAGGMPRRGVRVEHGWTERGQARSFSRVVRKAPETYTVTAGAGVVNTHITIEPVRDPALAWRLNDPPVVPPDLPSDQVVNEENRKELRALLYDIDSNATEALPRAMASDLPWLPETAGPALEMVRELHFLRNGLSAVPQEGKESSNWPKASCR